MALSNPQLETLTWVLIFSGLVIAALGVFVQRGGGSHLGGVLIVAGLAAAAAGIFLVWWRSRRPD
ncbi:MAG: hypothetical protein KIT17_16380 [Rubrivivax sp.]|nr:hypothetical protein [Rubrivivax sp.]